MNTAAAFADFRTYPLISALTGVQTLADHVLVKWADNRVSPFHPVSYTHLTLPTICSV